MLTYNIQNVTLLSLLLLGNVTAYSSSAEVVLRNNLNRSSQSRLCRLRRRLNFTKHCEIFVGNHNPVLKKAENGEMLNRNKYENIFLGVGVLSTAIAGGIITDLFRTAIEDPTKWVNNNESIFFYTTLVLLIALVGARSLYLALFAGKEFSKLGTIFLTGAVGTATVSVLTLGEGFADKNYFASTSAILLYITGGLIVFTLVLALARSNGFFRHNGMQWGQLVHVVGLVAVTGASCLFMNNLREGLYDDVLKGEDMSNHGLSFFAMIGCMAVGMLWFSYIMFCNKFQEGGANKWLSLIGAACLMGAGTCLVLGINNLSEITVANFSGTDLPLKDVFTEGTSTTFLFWGAALLIVIAVVIRSVQACKGPKVVN